MKELNIEIKTYAEVIKNEKNEKSNVVLRNLLYLKLLSKDIVLLTSVLQREKNHDKKNILSRTLASLLYEFYQDINNLYDKKFEKGIQQTLSLDMADALKSIKKMTAMVGSKYFEKLKLIRMNVGSHRDFDVVKQHDIINSIDFAEIIEISNFALFMIYFFNMFHISFTIKVLKKINFKIPDIPYFKNAQKDMKLWQLYVDHIAKKNNKVNGI